VFTARATTSRIVISAISAIDDWMAMSSFAIGVSGRVSVGLKAVASARTDSRASPPATDSNAGD
jgi:hypothetical protein